MEWKHPPNRTALELIGPGYSSPCLVENAFILLGPGPTLEHPVGIPAVDLPQLQATSH